MQRPGQAIKSVSSATRFTRSRWLAYLFATVAVAFTVVALWQSWTRSQQSLLPDALSLLLALVLAIVGLLAAGGGWLALFPHTRRRLLGDFYLSQLGKYIPGGIWQPAGQLGLTVGAGYTATRAAGNLGVHVVVQLAAGLFLGGFLLFDASAPTWIRIGAGFGLLAPVLVYRRWMSAALHFLGRHFGLSAEDLSPPGQRDMIRSWALAAGCLIAYGLAYGLLVHSLDGTFTVLTAIPAFALAWTIGFSLIFLPAGLGAREAALVVLTGGTAAVAIAASIWLRLIVVAGELLLVALSRAIRR